MTKRYLVILFLIIILFVGITGYTIYRWNNSQEQLQSQSDSSVYVTISARDAKQLIESKSSRELTILDVRDTNEFNEEHIHSSIVIPLEWLKEGGFELLNPNNTIIIYCQTGNRSTQASQFLLDEGYNNIFNLNGGISAWKEEGFPTVIRGEDEDCGCR
jgi:rhodanese-related sulfurtransferase